MLNNKDTYLISKIKYLIVIIVLFLVVLLCSSTFMLYSNIDNSKTMQREELYKLYANQLLDATEYLTNEAYKYVATGDDIYYVNYINEIDNIKRRENAVKSLLELGVTEDERKLISETLDLSNYLIQTDYAVFNLMAMEKDEEARELIFGEYCEALRQKILGNYKTLTNDINLKMQLETSNTFRVSEISYMINVIVVFSTIVASILLLICFYKLRDESDTDQMTGLQNRNKYKEKIKNIIGANPDKFGALIYCDIDNLKFINDCYGHKDGDKYIYEVSNKLRVFDDDNALLARPSGDEFVVYIHGFESQEDVQNAITSKFGELKNSYFTTSLNTKEKVRFSTGVAFYPTDSTDVESLLQYSDYAMINMKKTSKGEVGYYEKDNFDRSTFNFVNRGYLDELLDKEMIDFAMQPIVDANTYEIYGYEALMRPQYGVINTPYLLLQLAKDEAKLDKIERLVFKKVLEKIDRNQDKLKNRLVFINSIADQILTKNELDNLNNKYPNIFEKIIVEVTEQEYVGEELIKVKTDTLREYVTSIALDDYGAGYSNEFTLLSGIYDIVKIDMKLVRDIDIDPKRQEILHSIIKVAEYANYKVLAEGVETESEVKILKELGVNYFQGYYFGKPDLEIKELNKDVLEKIAIL